MAKKEKVTDKEKPEKDSKDSSAISRKRKRKVSKASRYAGAIMFLVCLLAGLMLWVGGEVRTTDEVDETEYERNDSYSGSSVIMFCCPNRLTISSSIIKSGVGLFVSTYIAITNPKVLFVSSARLCDSSGSTLI